MCRATYPFSGQLFVFRGRAGDRVKILWWSGDGMCLFAKRLERDHQPLYRQSQIYARLGVELDRATLAEWVGSVSTLVAPLIDSLGEYVMSAQKLHADDTPIPVLAPGTGKTKTGRLWTYVRDDQPAGSTDPPAVLFRYSPDRKGERPREHLEDFRGIPAGRWLCRVLGPVRSAA